VVGDESTIHLAYAKLEGISAVTGFKHSFRAEIRVQCVRALEKAAPHHVVELSLKRIETANNTSNFVVKMILVPVKSCSFFFAATVGLIEKRERGVLLDVEPDGISCPCFEVEYSAGALDVSVSGDNRAACPDNVQHVPITCSMSLSTLRSQNKLKRNHLDGTIQLAPQYRSLLRHHVIVRALSPWVCCFIDHFAVEEKTREGALVQS
jgi:hypothetical protein